MICKVSGVVMDCKKIEYDKNGEKGCFYQIDLYQKGEKELIRVISNREYSEGDVVTIDCQVYMKKYKEKYELGIREVE